MPEAERGQECRSVGCSGVELVEGGAGPDSVATKGEGNKGDVKASQ